jgi:hypothetical protein
VPLYALRSVFQFGERGVQGRAREAPFVSRPPFWPGDLAASQHGDRYSSEVAQAPCTNETRENQSVPSRTTLKISRQSFRRSLTAASLDCCNPCKFRVRRRPVSKSPQNSHELYLRHRGRRHDCCRTGCTVVYPSSTSVRRNPRAGGQLASVDQRLLARSRRQDAHVSMCVVSFVIWTAQIKPGAANLRRNHP